MSRVSSFQGGGGIFGSFLVFLPCPLFFSTVSQGARIEKTSLHTLRRGADEWEERNFCLPFGPQFIW